jgi:hypothetical protein
MKVILFLCFFFALSFSFSQESEIELMIAAEKVNCTDDDAKKCFQIKKTTDPHWTNQIDHIEGFEFEKGYEYHLRLIVRMPETPDGKITYKLVSIINQKKIN